MTQSALSAAIAATHAQLSIELARTPEQVLDAKRLRYRVYCEERGYEPGENGLEQDDYDDTSRHVLVRSRATGQVFGTVRVVLNTPDGPGMPMQHVTAAPLLAPYPLQTTAEISRFALTRDRTGLSAEAAALMRLCLIRGITETSTECKLTHWAATMERTLLRLLRSSGIHFLGLGPLVEYHGIRQPAIWAVEEGFARMKREQPAIWDFLTDGGRLLPSPAAALEVAA